ncbi:MAG: CerR family C-terminal domain-containing protein [Acidobacteriota bacterium]|nr:CerR family C-terminal domain-containing protein [Acidobacteriota bacterium]
MKKNSAASLSSPEDPTRAKLLEVAGNVFAEHGYQAATVREICTRAGANVAAVNYHFRDKMGLYEEVLRRSLCAAEHAEMRRTLSAFNTPEEALRGLISAMLHKMSRPGASNFRIMAHEMAQPSPALASVVEDVLRPNYNKAREIIGKILHLDPDHDTTRLCAHSLIGQVVHYAHARPAILLLWPALRLTPERVDQIAGHIADFTLCSLHALAQNGKTPARGGKRAKTAKRRA